MKNILFITSMYPDPLRPGTKVCHYFTREWVKMGYNVIVITNRSMFPSIYTTMARLFPKLAQKFIGNHVEMDTNKNIIQHEVEGIPVYSMPIFKYIPHGKFPKRSVDKQIKIIQDIITKKDFIPDAIIGHFFNPQMEIISKLKKIYNKAHTSIVFHEPDPSLVKKLYPFNYKHLLKSVDKIGFRSKSMKEMYEKFYERINKSFICYSGIPIQYIDKPIKNKSFNDGPLSSFIYIGQFIKRKFPKIVIETLDRTYNSKGFNLTYIGKKEICYEDVNKYVIENNLSDLVTFKGFLNRDEIINYLDKTECFIMISSGEVFGLVYLESMARGCITIGSRNEGIDGVIIDGYNGFLCNAGDSIELESIIKRINALSAEEKKKISNNAKKTAEQFSDYIVAKNYIEYVMNS